MRNLGVSKSTLSVYNKETSPCLNTHHSRCGIRSPYHTPAGLWDGPNIASRCVCKLWNPEAFWTSEGGAYFLALTDIAEPLLYVTDSPLPHPP
jgi:hypothetical protein